MAGRKNFVAGEILTASDVNSFLMDQSVMVFDDSTARGSAIPSPTEGMVTYRKDLGGAAGLEVFDGSAFGPVSGILQVVSATKTNTLSMASSTYADIPGLSVSITPSSTSSKIFIIFNVQAASNYAAGLAQIRLLRDSTLIAAGDTAGSRNPSSTGNASGDNFVIDTHGANFLDSPNTTSAITYKLQIRGNTANTVTVNRHLADADVASTPRTASTITVMEVAG